MNLVLFMTRGMSLTAWQDNGSLERELALYAELAKHDCKTSIISWGDLRDKAIVAPYPWLTVYVNRWHLTQHRYEKLMPLLHAWPLAHADIIKSNQANGSDCALRCARLWRKPFIARCGYIWSEFCRNMGSSELTMAQALERDVYSRCAHGIVTTNEAKKFFVEHYCISKNKISVLPNYVPKAYYELPLPDYTPRLRPIVTQVGRLAEQKNLFALIEACAGLPVTLRLVGDGPLKDELRQQAEQLGASVEFSGTASTAQLPQLLAESTIFTLVSRYEGHPKALIEAMARGCAVLGTRVPGIESLIKHEWDGLLCATDATSIQVGLKRLLNDAALRERLGKQARESVSHFRLPEVAAREMEIYHRFPSHSGIRKVFIAVSCAVKVLPKLLFKLLLKILRKLAHHSLSPKQTLYSTAAQPVDASPDHLMSLISSQVNGKAPADALRYLFDLEARIYSLEGAQAVAYGDGIHTKHRHTHYHDFFVERLQPGERVLDIGCGNGFLAYDMAAKGGGHVTGIELNAENVTIARRQFSHPDVRFVHGDALKDLPSGAYDTVVLSNVLEHLSGRVSFLRKIREHLRPTRFLLRVPLFERDWRVPLKKELGVEWRLDTTHETEYTQEQFACELACADLYITDFQIRWGEIWCEARTGVPYAQERPTNPRVTVLMAVHNGEQYLETAVTSILRQTLHDFDFLIVDDASTDATLQILGNLAAKDARIRILSNKKNLGLTASLNQGIAQIETSYIARMDADDISVPERLERQVAYMEMHPEVAAVGCYSGIFTASDDVECSVLRLPSSKYDIRKNTFLFGPQLQHPAALIRTSAIRYISKYRSQFKYAQDYDLWLRILEKYELSNIPKTLLFNREHKYSISQKFRLDQIINHIVALQSSEQRRLGLPDFMDSNEPSLELLISYLSPDRPSFYVWISFLAHLDITNNSALLAEALNLLLADSLKGSVATAAPKPLDEATIHRIHTVICAHQNDYDEKFAADISAMTENAATFYSYCAPYLYGKLWEIPHI